MGCVSARERRYALRRHSGGLSFNNAEETLAACVTSISLNRSTRHFAAPPAFKNSVRGTCTTQKPNVSNCLDSSSLTSFKTMVLPTFTALQANRRASGSPTQMRLSSGYRDSILLNDAESKAWGKYIP